MKVRTIHLALGCTLLAPLASAQEKKPPPDPQIALKKSMRARYATLVKLIRAGKVGESHTGYVDLVKAEYGAQRLDPKNEKSAKISTVVAAENADRKRLYGILAEKNEITAAEIGVQSAVRNFRRAHDDDYLQLRSGRWVQWKVVKEQAKKKKKGGGDKKGTG